MVRQPPAELILHRLRKPGIHAGTAQELRAFDGPRGEHDGDGAEHANVVGQRVAADELEVAAVVLDVLDEVVEHELHTRTVSVFHAGREAGLVDEQLGGVEHTGGLGEEAILGRAVWHQVRLVQGAGRFLDGEVERERALPQLRYDRLRGGAHRPRFVHRFARRVEQAALQILPDARGEELEFPSLDRWDQAGPEDGTATEIEHRLAADEVLGGVVSILPERVAAEVVRHAGVREAAQVVDMGRVDERPRFQHENAFIATEALGKIVCEHAATDSGADDDDVEVVPRPDVLQEEALLRRGGRGNEVDVLGCVEAHRFLPSEKHRSGRSAAASRAVASRSGFGAGTCATSSRPRCARLPELPGAGQRSSRGPRPPR
jgi:hypothetical protein